MPLNDCIYLFVYLHHGTDSIYSRGVTIYRYGSIWRYDSSMPRVKYRFMLYKKAPLFWHCPHFHIVYARRHAHLKRTHPHLKRTHPHLKRTHPHLKRTHPHLKRTHAHLKRTHTDRRVNSPRILNWALLCFFEHGWIHSDKTTSKWMFWLISL